MEVYAMAGTIGSGKSSLSKIFAKENDMIYISTGDYLRKIALKNGYDIYERKNIEIIFNEIIKNGWKYFCENIFSDLKFSEKSIVVDSIKGIESYFALKEFFTGHQVFLIYCHINESVSILRQIKRGDKNIYDYSNELIDFDDLISLENEANIVLDTSYNIDKSFEELQLWYEGRKNSGRM